MGLALFIKDQTNAEVASANFKFQWQDPSPSTENSKWGKHLCMLLCAKVTRFEQWLDQLPLQVPTASQSDLCIVEPLKA